MLRWTLALLMLGLAFETFLVYSRMSTNTMYIVKCQIPQWYQEVLICPVF